LAANLTNHNEITVYQTMDNGPDKTDSLIEKAGQTFVKGTPVQLTGANQAVTAWDGATVAKGIAGIASMDASNYATDGAGAPGPFGQVGFPGAQATFGKVPFESSAVNIARGAPAVDGRTVFAEANPNTLFLAQVDNSAFAVAADATPVNGDVGKQFGMTIDASGHWYVDRAKVTVGTNTVCEVVMLDPNLGSVLNGNVVIKFVISACQLVN
jgi:hypothetical protein